MKLLGQCPQCDTYLAEGDKVGVFTIRCPQCRHLHDNKTIEDHLAKTEAIRKESHGDHWWQNDPDRVKIKEFIKGHISHEARVSTVSTEV